MPRATIIDEWQGIKTGWWKDRATGKNVVVNKQDCSDILRLTAHSRNHERVHNALGDPLVASIPVVEYYRGLAEHGIDARTWFHMPRSEKRKWERRMLGGDWSKFKATDKRF